MTTLKIHDLDSFINDDLDEIDNTTYNAYSTTKNSCSSIIDDCISSNTITSTFTDAINGNGNYITTSTNSSGLLCNPPIEYNGSLIDNDLLRSSSSYDNYIVSLQNTNKYPTWINKHTYTEIIDILNSNDFCIEPKAWGLKGWTCLKEFFDLNSDTGKIIRYIIDKRKEINNQNDPLVFNLDGNRWLGKYQVAFIQFRENSAILMVSPDTPKDLINNNILLDTIDECLINVVKTIKE